MSETSIARLPWRQRPVWVLVLLFVVLGPFGLPYLWKTPAFSRGMKIALTVCVIAYTGVLIVKVIALVGAVRDVMGQLGLDLDDALEP